MCCAVQGTGGICILDVLRMGWNVLLGRFAQPGEGWIRSWSLGVVRVVLIGGGGCFSSPLARG
jgi:hypothetical protein